MFLCVNGNFRSPVERMLIILSDKKSSICNEKIGRGSHSVEEWPVFPSVSEALSFLLFLHPPCLSVSFSLSPSFLCVSVSDWVKYHLSGECCLDWHEIRTDQLDSYMLFLLLLLGIRLWCTSTAWTRGNNNMEVYIVESQNYCRHQNEWIIAFQL